MTALGLLDDALCAAPVARPAIQVALSIALVACTGVLAQTLVNLETSDLGFDLDGLYEVDLRPSSIGYDPTIAMRSL